MELAPKTIRTKNNNMTIRIRDNTSFICSIGKAPTVAEVEIIYVPNNVVLELESTTEFINSLAMAREFTIEDYTSTLYEVLAKTLEPKKLIVKVRAKAPRHGWVEVTVPAGD